MSSLGKSDAQNVPVLNQVDISQILDIDGIGANIDDLNQYLDDLDEDGKQNKIQIAADKLESYTELDSCSMYANQDEQKPDVQDGSFPSTPAEPESPVDDPPELLSPSISSLQFLEQMIQYSSTLVEEPASPSESSYDAPESPTESIAETVDLDCYYSDVSGEKRFLQDIDTTIDLSNGDLGESSHLISDCDLINLSVRDLNRKLKTLSSADVKQLKQRRRLLKNRGYAQTCRSRRIKEQKDLSYQNNSLKQTIKDLQNELCRVIKERDEYKEKYEHLSQGTFF